MVEDSADVHEQVARSLGRAYRIARAETLEEARRHLARETPDLLLLDLELPDGDGFHLCSELRGNPTLRKTPILFLSSHTAIRDKVMAFELGADDYLEKPFDAAELRARVQRWLRRQREAGPGSELVRGPLSLDTDSFRARLGDAELPLTPSEFRLLRVLLEEDRRAWTRRELVFVVGGGAVVTERTVDTHVCNLRRKLGPLQDCIESVRGVGYRFCAARLPPPGAVRKS